MVLRIFWNLATGIASHAVAKKTAKPGLGVLYPTVWKARTGFLDCDVNLHLNNASYLYAMELARWHFAGRIGMMPMYFKEGMVFLAAANSIRYRHAIPPFAAYEIQTRIIHWDDDWMYFLQQFVSPTSGKVYAEGLCRATVKKGKGRVPMRDIYRAATGLDVEPGDTLPAVVEEFLKWDAASKTSMEMSEAKARSAKQANTPSKEIWSQLTLTWNNPLRKD